MNKSALVLLALLAAGCAPSPAPVIPVITATRAYTVPEQVEIAREHAVLTGEQLYRLKDGQFDPVDLHMMPVVLDEWERTRQALKAVQ
jgi:hypothetical protein